MFPCEEANDQSCREGAEPRRAGSARDAGAWGGRLPARRHLHGKSSLQDGWIGPGGFTREDHAARHRLGVRPVHHSERKREGATFVVHVECKGPGGSQMLSDVNFTPREDKTLDFSDQDQTYKAVLHRCSE